MNKKKHNSLVMAIIGLIIIGLCIIWIIRIYWPVIIGEKPYGLGLEAMELALPLTGIMLGGLLIFFGIYGVLESKKSKGLFLIVSGSILMGLIMYFLIIFIHLLLFLPLLFIILVFPIVMIGLGSREVSKSRRKSIVKEGLGTKMKAATNVTYMLRIEKEVLESGAERTNYICGYCELKNNLKTIDEDRGIFQCLNCGAENHLLK